MIRKKIEFYPVFPQEYTTDVFTTLSSITKNSKKIFQKNSILDDSHVLRYGEPLQPKFLMYFMHLFQDTF